MSCTARLVSVVPPCHDQGQCTVILLFSGCMATVTVVPAKWLSGWVCHV